MESPQSVAANPAKTDRLKHLITLATSQRVLSNAAMTLDVLGMSSGILYNASVKAIKDTDIIAVEVTGSDPFEAKVAADVIAAELKRAYHEIMLDNLKADLENLESQLVPAEKKVRQAYSDVEQTKKRSAEPADVALAEADAKAAADSYADIKKQVARAKLEVKRVENKTYIKTIDPAYVFPVKKRFSSNNKKGAITCQIIQ